MNRLVITAHIAEIKPLRYTPAGLPALDVVLEHESEVSEAGGKRQVKASVRAVAFGSMAEQISRMAIGSPCRFSGFMASRRNSASLVLHIQEFSSDLS